MSKWRSAKNAAEEERWILSIDGGGIRGIVPATVLTVLERMLKENGDERPLYSHFDLIAGTSTGGIIAASLSAPLYETSLLKRAEGPDYDVFKTTKKLFRKERREYLGAIEQKADLERIASLYFDHGKDIFEPKNKLFGALFSERYNERTLEFFFHRLFQGGLMEELTVPTLIVCHDPLECEPHFFRSYEDKDVLIRDALRATSAAPMYFSPYKVNGNHALIDGGMIANNPSLFAYREARKLYPECKKFHILSLSTLSPKTPIDVTEIGGGFAGWAEPITKIYSHAQLETVDIISASLPDTEYIRIWSDIKGEKIRLDDVRPESVMKLKNMAETMIGEKNDTLMDVAERLSKKPLSKEFPLTLKLLEDKRSES
jgi:Patatin